MGRSSNRRTTRRIPDRRLLAAAAALVLFGGLIGVAQISSADTTTPEPSASASSAAGKVINGLTILTNTCADSSLPRHDGFQIGDRCVSTEFGEVGVAANNPSLLITQAPRSVAVNTPFTLKISTRNLIRDRFLAAGKGGYYLESSVLQNGLVRGHFHTACRMLSSTRVAPDPAPVPAFFVATEDSKGGREPDTVTINVPGMPTTGTAQCASWAGDGSHRIPMMERANQTPALDTVRIQVRRSDGAPSQPGDGTSGQPSTSSGQPGTGTPGQPDTTSGQPGGTSTGSQTGGTGTSTGSQTGGPPPQPGSSGDDPTDDPSDQPSSSASTQPSSSSSSEPDAGTAAPAPVKGDPTKNSVAPTTSAAAPAGGGTGTRDNSSGGAKSSGGSKSTRSQSTSSGGGSAAAGNQESTDTAKAPAPKATSKKAAAADTGDDQAYLDPNANPDPQSDAQQQSGGQASGDTGLALTGTNTVMAIGGGFVLLIIGLFVLNSTTRRRRPRHFRL
jgi:hypothetical protein